VVGAGLLVYFKKPKHKDWLFLLCKAEWFTDWQTVTDWQTDIRHVHACVGVQAYSRTHEREKKIKI
jgi:hypothetical protein